MTIRVSITNQEPVGGKDVLAQLFHVDAAGHADEAAYESRIVFPGVTAVLHLKPGNVVTLQEAPELAPAKPAARREYPDGEC